MDIIAFKKRAIAEVIEREGGSRYTNRAADFGGPTRWGVTQAKARDHGYNGDMRHYPYEEAYKVFEAFWDDLQCFQIAQRDPSLALYVFDFGVNSGDRRAAKFFQQLLNVLNNRQKIYSDIKDDGVIGRLTIGALDSYLGRRGDFGKLVIREAYNAERISFLTDLARRRESQEENLYGWLSRVIRISEECGCSA